MTKVRAFWKVKVLHRGRGLLAVEFRNQVDCTEEAPLLRRKAVRWALKLSDQWGMDGQRGFRP